MRFMVIVKATQDSEAGVMPSEKLLAEMGKFNEELAQAGIMLAGEGLCVGRDSGAGTRYLDAAALHGAKRTDAGGGVRCCGAAWPVVWC